MAVAKDKAADETEKLAADNPTLTNIRDLLVEQNRYFARVVEVIEGKGAELQAELARARDERADNEKRKAAEAKR